MPRPISNFKSKIRRDSFRQYLVLFAVLFLGLRLLCLLTAIETFSYPEELLRGNIGTQIMQGLQKPLWDYQIDPYSGGSLAVAALAALFFSVLGKTLFALKLVPVICFYLPAGFLMILFLRDFFSARAAVFGALLFIFPAPAMLKMSAAAMGFHSESILFNIGILYAYYGWKTRESGDVYLTAFGVLSGLGIWFTPLTAVSTACCLLDAAFNHRSKLRSRALLLAFAFLLGLMPSLLYNLSHRLDGFHFIANGFVTKERFHEGPLAFLQFFKQRISGLLFRVLPLSYGFQCRFENRGEFLSFVYCLLSMAACAGISWDFIKQKKLGQVLPLVLYPVLFTVVYAASNFDFTSQESLMDSRYFIPLHFYLGMTAAIFAAGEGKLRKAVYGLILGLGLVSYSAFVFKSDFGRVFQYQGFRSSVEEFTDAEIQNAAPETFDRIYNNR